MEILFSKILTERALPLEVDLDTLAKDIKVSGLRHPILVDHEFNLIDGLRRIYAYELLGHKQVPAIVSKTFDGSIKVVHAAHHDDRWPVEIATDPRRMWEIKVALDPQVKARSDAIKRHSNEQRRKGRDPAAKGNYTRMKLAEALGLGGVSPLMAISVLNNDLSVPGEIGKSARQCLDLMYSREVTIHAAYAAHRRRVADRSRTTDPSIQRQVLKSVSQNLIGLVRPLEDLSSNLHPSLKDAELGEWERDLNHARSRIQIVVGKIRRARKGEVR